MHNPLPGFVSQRIDESQPRKIPLVVGNDDATIGLGDGGDDQIEGAAWPSLGRAVRHQLRPDQARLLVESEHAACEKGLRSFLTGEPGFQQSPLFPFGLFQQPAPDLRNGQRRNEQVIVRLFRHPREKGCGWTGLRDVADDVGVEEVACHRSTLRPVS
jgi:hypothetical protein